MVLWKVNYKIPGFRADFQKPGRSPLAPFLTTAIDAREKIEIFFKKMGTKVRRRR
jgi:hypothetical protein